MYKVGDLVQLTEKGAHYWDGLGATKHAWCMPEYFVVEAESKVNWVPDDDWEKDKPCVNAYCKETDRWFTYLVSEFGSNFEPYEHPFEMEWVDFA